MILQKIKSFLQSEEDERIGVCWVEEVLPVFHDSACTTNKTVYIVNKLVEPNIYEAFELRNPFNKTVSPFRSQKAVTQEGLPLKFDKKQNALNSIGLEKNGYREGVCIHIEGLGYLGDLKSTLKTWIVTDNYVFFKEIGKNSSIYVYSYAELNRMCIEFIS